MTETLKSPAHLHVAADAAHVRRRRRREDGGGLGEGVGGGGRDALRLIEGGKGKGGAEADQGPRRGGGRPPRDASVMVGREERGGKRLIKVGRRGRPPAHPPRDASVGGGRPCTRNAGDHMRSILPKHAPPSPCPGCRDGRRALCLVLACCRKRAAMTALSDSSEPMRPQPREP